MRQVNRGKVADAQEVKAVLRACLDEPTSIRLFSGGRKRGRAEVRVRGKWVDFEDFLAERAGTTVRPTERRRQLVDEGLSLAQATAQVRREYGIGDRDGR